MSNECISFHPHAMYNQDGLVVDLVSFGGHESDVVNDIVSTFGYAGALSICELGPIGIGDSWDGENITRRVIEPEPVLEDAMEDE